MDALEKENNNKKKKKKNQQQQTRERSRAKARWIRQKGERSGLGGDGSGLEPRRWQRCNTG